MPKNLVFADDLLYEEVEDVYYQPEEAGEFDPLASFLEDGTLTEVIGEIKSGKEGTVYCCRGGPNVSVELVAAKLFRSRDNRTFRDQSIYREGFVILNKRDQRALKKKSAWGQRVEDSTWMYHEYETLRALFRAGADVPKPVRLSDRVLLMEYIGDEEMAAPKLQEVQLNRDEAHLIFDRVLGNIELFLGEELVHADLSAYNVLYWDGAIRIIDFPQAVDPRKNRNARDLLLRDVTNICTYFRRWGVESDPTAFVNSLWRRYVRAEL